MPQPLTSLPQIKSHALGVDVVDARPEHMHAAMRIIAAAAFSDQWLGNILVGLDPKKAVKIAKQFSSLESDAKKTASFEATAGALLDEDQHELLRRIVVKHRSASKLRHPFAHHRFGFTDDDKDLLLTVDPRHELLDRAKRNELDARPPKNQAEKDAWWEERRASAKAFHSSIMAYRLKELESIREEISEATLCLTQFWQITARVFPPHICDQVSARLMQRLQ